MRHTPTALVLSTVTVMLASASCGGGALSRQAAQMNARGAAQLERGDTAGAEASFHLALEYNDHFAEPYNNLGLVDLVHHRLRDARAHFRAAIEHNHDFAEAWSNLGNSLVERADAHDAEGGDMPAMSAWHEALAINPGLVEARVNLVRAQLRTGRAREAIDQSRRLVQVAPDVALAHELRSVAALAVNAPAEALESAREARRLDAHDPEVAIVLAQAELAGGSPANVPALVDPLLDDATVGVRAHALKAAALLTAGDREGARRVLAQVGADGAGEPLVRAVRAAMDTR